MMGGIPSGYDGSAGAAQSAVFADRCPRTGPAEFRRVPDPVDRGLALMPHLRRSNRIGLSIRTKGSSRFTPRSAVMASAFCCDRPPPPRGRPAVTPPFDMSLT